MLTPAEEHALIMLAARARLHAYAPYSGFQVGAAAVADDSRTFYGCNVENASLGLTLCAERAAMAAGVAAGVRRFQAIVLVADSPTPCLPCGACLQWLSEFSGRDVWIVSANLAGVTRRERLCTLLKEPFRR